MKKMKKRIFAAVLALTMMMSMAACSNGDSEENTTENESGAEEGGDNTLNIGMAWAILDDGQTNLTNAITESLENDFPDYEIETTLTNADGDITKLIDDVESLIATDPDMIYIMNSVGDSGVIPAINACNDAGIPVGIGVAVEGDVEYTYLYEGFSNYACGQMQAEYMESIYDENEEYKVACITGDAGNTSGVERTAGFVENFVDKHDNVELVIQGEGNFLTDDSQALAEDWLISHPEINVIACVNDDEAQGVINACKAAGRDDVIILGIDASDVGTSNVESGDQAATVGIDFGGVAYDCAQAMVQCATGQLDTNEVKYTTENLYLVTSENE